MITQATFSRFAFQIGPKTALLVKIFIFILFRVCYPIEFILDDVLADEMATIYSKKELIQIVKEHGGTKESDVDADEERIIEGALSFSDKSAEQVMTPRTVIYILDISTSLDEKLLNKIKEEGFTRIPVYKNSIDNVVGILYAKDLINIKLGTKIEKVYKKEKILTVPKQQKLDQVLNMFIKSKVHLALVKNEYHGLEGVVALEDIIEEILEREIVDETDQVPDLQKKARGK